MKGIDTNVLVRMIMRDDAEQTAIADSFMASLSASKPGYVPLVAAVELWWVLSSSYRRTHDQLCALFEELIDSDDLVFESADDLRAGLVIARSGAGLADALIAVSSQASGCTSVVTFDKAAVKKAGMTHLTSAVARS
ncbi:MAG: type II toxin-antitoxin system VapC family toxin [Propionibacteriaceae bacterium]|jgi:predicted nucleic-acid-binding protein|nr:type II toxin-antitoxin system VapC family toxin [Propionibacteriaceae bacterium]